MSQYGAIILLLFAAVALSTAAPKMKLPYPILLMIGGIAIGLVPRYANFMIEPNVVFLLFLPPLLYDASSNIEFREFRANFNTITFLAVSLVLLTMVAIAVVAHLIVPGLSWPLAFLLGAILAPPDAVAAISTAKELGLPRQTATILESEGMMNDATALIAARFAVAAVAGTAFNFGHALADFTLALIGGVLVGFGIWTIYRILMRRFTLTDQAMVSFSLLLPFVAYWLADAFDLSGVLAVVTLGLMVARNRDRPRIRKMIEHSQPVLDTATFLLNGLIFIVLGIIFPHVIKDISNGKILWLVLCSLAIFLVALVVRFAVIAYYKVRQDNARFLRQHHHRKVRRSDLLLLRASRSMSWKEVVVIGWTGMRGLVSLAVALSLPLTVADDKDFPQRETIIFLTVTTVIIMLIVQGLGVSPLMRWLKLEEKKPGDKDKKRADRSVRPHNPA